MYRFRKGLGATLSDLAAAITRQEGSCSAAGVCRNNNPGNLRTPGSGFWPGQTGIDENGLAVFDSFQSGQAALLSQERYNINRGLTLEEFFGGKPGVYPGYAPAADKNNPGLYASNVASWIGIPSDVPLSQVLQTDSGPSYVPPLALAVDDSSGLDLSGETGMSPLAWLGIGLVGVGIAFAVAS